MTDTVRWMQEEIERLRKELAREEEEHNRCTTFHAIAVKERNYERVLALKRDAEIERLRDELSHCLHLDNHNAIVANRNEEIERLRAENDALKIRIGTYYSGNPDGGTVKMLEAEIERLRKTLDDHLDSEAAETRRADRERDRARAAEAEIGRLREGERAADAEIERLREQATQRGARMQVMRAYLTSYSGPSTTLWRDFCRVRPEAAAWFDEEGVPR